MNALSVIERLDFGHDDAERDIARGLLAKGFQETAAYNAALSGRKMLVIGRKGTGKSAICVRLASASHPAPQARGLRGAGTATDARACAALLITPDDATGDDLRRFELAPLAGDTARALLWRYVFAMQTARHLVEHAPVHRGRTPASVRALRRFLRQNGEPAGDQAPLSQRVSRAVQGLRGALTLEAFGLGASVQWSGAPTEGARAAEQVQIVEEGIALAFRELGCEESHPPLLIMVDQLEQIWQSGAESHSLVIGLLLAARHAGSRYHRAVNCLLFLRSDIYDSLSFGEGDKFRSDELRLTWTRAELTELARRRASVSVGTQLSAEELWRSVFPPTVAGEDTVGFLFRRMLPRPRDVIQYLNTCQAEAAAHGPGDRISEEAVLAATHRFSQWKIKDLIQEYRIAHPFLERLIPLFQSRAYVVDRDELGDRTRHVLDLLHREFPAYAEALTLSGILQTLFATGFLGVRRGEEVVYADGPQLSVQPHENEFHVHPCYRAALDASAQRAAEPVRVSGHVIDQVLSGNVNAIHSGGGTRPRRAHLLLADARRSCAMLWETANRTRDLRPPARAEALRLLGAAIERIDEVLTGRSDRDPLRLLREITALYRGLYRRVQSETTGPDTDLLLAQLQGEGERIGEFSGGGGSSSSGFSS